MTRSNRSIYKAMESAAGAVKREKYVLRLYVAGTTPRSREAIRIVTEICREQLAGRCDLQVIDLYQQPLLARSEQIVALPTLVREKPVPFRKLVGSMADKEKLLAGLDLSPKASLGNGV